MLSIQQHPRHATLQPSTHYGTLGKRAVVQVRRHNARAWAGPFLKPQGNFFLFITKMSWARVEFATPELALQAARLGAPPMLQKRHPRIKLNKR